MNKEEIKKTITWILTTLLLVLGIVTEILIIIDYSVDGHFG